ncbi:MAG: helix-turn-helix domain-containing protein [Acutalibacteraceae bacterium]
MDVLKRINQLRIDRNWSVYRLSVESGLPQSTITNMFNRETLPSIITLQAICDGFGITMAEFFTEETEKTDIDYNEFKSTFDRLPNNTKQTVFNLMKEMVNK